MKPKSDRGKVRVYTNVANAAMKAKEAVGYKTWTLLRHYDPGGQSWYYIKDAIQLITEKFGQTRRYAKDIINKYDGRYWDIHHHSKDSIIQIYSLVRIVQRLELDDEGDKVLYEESEVFSSTFDWRSRTSYGFMARDAYKLVTSELKPAGWRTMSRRAIKDRTGVSKRTQLKYESRFGITKKRTDAAVKVTDGNINQIPLRAFQYGKYRDVDGDGEKELVFQTSNSYRVPFEYVAHKSKMKLAGSSKSNGGIIHNSSYDAKRHSRIFFDDNSRAYKAIGSNRISEAGIYAPYFETPKWRMLRYIPPMGE